MMKKHLPYKKFIHLFIVFSTSFAACKNSSHNISQTSIQGIWQADSTINYLNGEEETIYPKKELIAFTKYNEAVFVDPALEKNQFEKKIFQYTVEDDSILFQSLNVKEWKFKHGIQVINENNIVMTYELKVDYIDKSQTFGRMIYTTYYHRIDQGTKIN